MAVKKVNMAPIERPTIDIVHSGNDENRAVQMNIYVPEDMRDKLKLRALQEKRSVSEIARELFTEYLNN